MKKHLFTLLALLALTVSAWAQSQIGPIDGFYYEIDGSGNATLIKLPGSDEWASYEISGDITIPGTVNDGVSDYTVTAIGQKAFVSVGISSVTIEEGVTDIYADAFLGSSLQTATLPSTITYIGNQSFDYTALTAFVITATSPASFGGGNPFSLSNVPTLEHIYVPAASVDAYKTAWSSYASLIEEKPVWVTWNQADVESVNLVAISEGATSSQTVKDITVTASSPASGDYATFSTSEYGNSISIHDGGTITFAPTSGKLKGISISCGGYADYTHLAASSGWTWNNSKYTLEWSGEEPAESVVLACDGSSDGIYFGQNTSIVFTLEAEAEPAPAVITTTVTWDTEEVSSISLNCENVDDVANSEEIDGITASLRRIASGGNCEMGSSSARDLWMNNGCGQLTFTSSVGNISGIVLYASSTPYTEPYNLPAGWTWNSEAKTLSWTGTAAAAVTLSGSMDFLVGSIGFTVESAAAPATTTTTITWDQADIESLGLADNDVDEFSASNEINDITASLTRTNAGQNTYCQISNRNFWITNGCGSLTFSHSTGKISNIVITYDDNYSYHSLSDLTAGWTEDTQAHTLTWTGTASDEVTLSGGMDIMVSSIEFTVGTESAPADPEPETIPGPSFTWEQRQVNHVRLIGNSSGDPETAPVIKNIITSITQTSNGGNCYFGYWGEKGKLNIGNCGYLTFQSLVGELRAIVITCSTVTTVDYLPADWTYDSEAGTLTWIGTTASDEVSISGNINIDISEIEFYYTAASAPRLGETFYDAAYQLYEITGAKTAKLAQQQWLSHTLDIPASVEDGGVTYYITEIDDYAYQNDLDLPNVMGGANIGRIGAHAFDGCHRMDEIDIESEVLDEIGEAAFKGCKLMQDIGFYTELPPVLGEDAFADTRYLNHIIVPSGNLTDYQTAWSTYAAKISPSGSSPQVDDQFFHHNQTTTNIYAVLSTSPREAKVLPYTAEVNAIYPITRTGTLVIPEEALYIHNMYTITGIGANAYKDSTRFTTVMMPQAVKLIEEGAFRNCTGVEKVYFLWDDPTTVTWADGNVGADFKTAASGNTKIFVPENRLDAYKAWAPAWASCMIGADILDVTATGDPNNNLRHYRTFYDSEVDYLMPPSVWAHAGYIDGSDFILRSVAFDGEILPRGTAVVLESETPTYRLIPVGNDAPLYTGRNDLVGTDVAIPRTSVGNNGENVYVLGKQATVGGDLRVGMGMYRYTGTTLGAHKAYLIYNAPSGQQNAPVRFLFKHEDQATDVENVGVQSDKASCAKILRNGQLIIIKDGKEYNAQGQVVK